MNIEAFLTAYNDRSRNGANKFFRHPLQPSLIYSDGMQEVAEAGFYWLVDLAAFEFALKLATQQEYLGVITFTVEGGSGEIVMTGAADRVLLRKPIEFTDAPDGVWKFFLGNDGDHFTLILPTEY